MASANEVLATMVAFEDAPLTVKVATSESVSESVNANGGVLWFSSIERSEMAETWVLRRRHRW